jgi:hypothetical protein
MHIGTISAAAVFKENIPLEVVKKALAGVEVRLVDGTIGLPDAVGDQFSALCDLYLQQLMRGTQNRVVTLRADGGTGWADYRRGYYQFACELLADECDFDDAEDLLLDVAVLDRLEPMLKAATKSFVCQYLPAHIFEDYMASYAVET